MSTANLVDADVADILGTLQEWNIQATSGHNDGWVAQGFKNKLILVQRALNNMLPGDEDDTLDNYDSDGTNPWVSSPAKKVEDVLEESDWICYVCKRSTYELDYDYIVHPQLCLPCALKQENEEHLEQVETDF